MAGGQGTEHTPAGEGNRARQGPRLPLHRRLQLPVAPVNWSCWAGLHTAVRISPDRARYGHAWWGAAYGPSAYLTECPSCARAHRVTLRRPWRCRGCRAILGATPRFYSPAEQLTGRNRVACGTRRPSPSPSFSPAPSPASSPPGPATAAPSGAAPRCARWPACCSGRAGERGGTCRGEAGGYQVPRTSSGLEPKTRSRTRLMRGS